MIKLGRYSLVILLVVKSFSVFANIKEHVNSATEDYLAEHFLNATFMFADKDNVLEMGVKGLFSLHGVQLTANQIMPIASGTKPMTAAAILKLQEAGKLNVQDRVSKHLDKDSYIWDGKPIPEWAKKVTIHHLLTHSSGLAEYFASVKIDSPMSHEEINKQIITFASSKPNLNVIGKEYNYSSTNFVILGLIIEKITGVSVAEFFEQEFFMPLEMRNTRMLSLKDVFDIRDKGEEYDPYPSRYFVKKEDRKVKFIPAKLDFILVPYADGGVVSNTGDLIKWHKALHQGKILSEASYKMMIKRYFIVPQVGKNNVKKYAGYGIFISELDSHNTMIHHPGSAVGIRSESGYLPNKGIYFAILSNVMKMPEMLGGQNQNNQKEDDLDIAYFRDYILTSVAN